MKDNLSIVITMIVFVILLVIFPLYNYFERQDDMSYNMVLKATTNFTDEIINCGYIDQDMCNKFISKLAVTGNLFDIQIEAHKKVFTPDMFTDNSNEFIEQYEIDYNDDIFKLDTSELEDGNVKNIDQKVLKRGVYHLNAGDQIYVKVKNTNTTMASAIFNIIVPTSTSKRLSVSYGGIVKNNAWKNTEISNLMSDDIFVEMSLEDNFDIEDYKNKEIVCNIRIINSDKNEVNNVENILKNKLKLKGFENKKEISCYKVEKISSNDKELKYKAYFNLNNLNNLFFGNNISINAYVELPSDVIQGNYYKNPLTLSDSVKVSNTTLDLNNIYISGPYTGSGNIINSIEVGQDFYYTLFVNKNSGISKETLVNSIRCDNINILNGNFEVDFDGQAFGDIDRYKVKFKDTYGDITQTSKISVNIAGNIIKSNLFKYKVEKKEYKEPKIYEYNVPIDGKYKITVVGANGTPNSNLSSNRGIGGRGGLTEGTINLKKGSKLYVYVGSTPQDFLVKGGFNGGGKGLKISSNAKTYFGGAGGGATDVRLPNKSETIGINVESLNESSFLNSRIIVAGGGGGASYDDSSLNCNGGAGGGANSTGENGYINGDNKNGAKAGSASTYKGESSQETLNKICGAGGGGYRGGLILSGEFSGGAGGSGYINKDKFFNIRGINGFKKEVNKSTGNGYAIIEYLP